MPPARLYADENFALGAVTELRRLGHDVLTAYEDGRANQTVPDEDVLARAVTLGRALLTMNRKDFKRLHWQVVGQGKEHAGIVICTYDPDFPGQAARIAEAVAATPNLRGQIASHIKPRAACTDEERRDYINNVVPMCLLGCDALFEHGIIAFEGGRVCVRIDYDKFDGLGKLLRQLNGKAVLAWELGCQKYFGWRADQPALSRRDFS